MLANSPPVYPTPNGGTGRNKQKAKSPLEDVTNKKHRSGRRNADDSSSESDISDMSISIFETESGMRVTKDASENTNDSQSQSHDPTKCAQQPNERSREDVPNSAGEQ